MSQRGGAGHRVPGLEGRCGRAWPGLRPCAHVEAHAGLGRPGAPWASGPVPMCAHVSGKSTWASTVVAPLCPLPPVSDATSSGPCSVLSVSSLHLHRCLQASSSCGSLCRERALVRELHG